MSTSLATVGSLRIEKNFAKGTAVVNIESYSLNLSQKHKC